MLKKYLELYSTCNTTNKVNQLHLQLEEKLTPFELHTLFQNMALDPSQFNKQQTDWILKLYAMYSRSGVVQPEFFETKIINRSVLRYSNNKIPQNKKTLIICFTGTRQRMMMPKPVFLQHIDFKNNDLIYVQTYRKMHSYINGMPDLGNNFTMALDTLYQITQADNYQHVITFGCSSGSLPSLIMTLKYGFKACLIAGPQLSLTDEWKTAIQEDIPSLLHSYKSRYNHEPMLISLFADEYLPDKEAANAFKKLVPMRFHKVNYDDSMNIHPHAVLAILVRQGIFRKYLSNLIQSTMKSLQVG